MFAWFLSPIGRKVGLGIAAFFLAFTLYKMWEHKIALEAAKKEAAKELEDKDKILKQERTETQNQLAVLQTAKEAAEQREKNTQVVLKGLTQQLASIANQRVLDREAISRIPDDKLAGDVRQRVGLTRNDSLTFTFSEIRVVDETLSALPTMKAEIDTLKQTSKTNQEQVTAVKDQLAAVGKQLDTTLAYNRRLEEAYKQAYDTAQKFRRRSWIIPIVTFGLVHRDRKIDLPPPLALKPATP